MQLGEFKQEINRINNKINMDIMNQGLLAQRTDVFYDKVIIVGYSRRVRVLSYADDSNKLVSVMMDRIIIEEFKRRFKQDVQEQLGIKVVSFLKDYDPDTEISCSIAIFEKPVEELIKDL